MPLANQAFKGREPVTVVARAIIAFAPRRGRLQFISQRR